MKLEVGKKYRNRNGDVHGPMKITKSHPDRFTDEMGNWYGDDGHYWQQRPDCPYSLIAPVEDSREAQADIEAVADAIDLARYQHPTHPRERPRPFSEADECDREYATRLARAAMRARPILGVQRPEDVARVIEAFCKQQPCGNLRGINNRCAEVDDGGSICICAIEQAYALRIADAIAALPHTGQPVKSSLPERDVREWIDEHTGQPQEGAREAELEEIADGAWGDNPAVRGAARDRLRARADHCAACGEYMPPHARHMCANWPPAASPPAPVAESGWQPTPSQVTDAVWEVLATWRPGMSDEVKHTLGVKIAERFARKADDAPPHIAEEQTGAK